MPIGIDRLTGVTEMEESVATVTVKEPIPVFPSNDAVIITVPPEMPVASPTVLIWATAVFDELHVTDVVIFWVEPLLNVPVALNAFFVPTPIEGVPEDGGSVSTVIEERVKPDTVNVEEATLVIELIVIEAVSITVPASTPLANPKPSTVPMLVSDELHAT